MGKISSSAPARKSPASHCSKSDQHDREEVRILDDDEQEQPNNNASESDMSEDDQDSHMDECFICDDGGELICCDGCPKAYHEKCLNIKSKDLPDVWHCPSCVTEKKKNAAGNNDGDKKATPNNDDAVKPLSSAGGGKIVEANEVTMREGTAEKRKGILPNGKNDDNDGDSPAESEKKKGAKRAKRQSGGSALENIGKGSSPTKHASGATPAPSPKPTTPPRQSDGMSTEPKKSHQTTSSTKSNHAGKSVTDGVANTSAGDQEVVGKESECGGAKSNESNAKQPSREVARKEASTDNVFALLHSSDEEDSPANKGAIATIQPTQANNPQNVGKSPPCPSQKKTVQEVAATASATREKIQSTSGAAKEPLANNTADGSVPHEPKTPPISGTAKTPNTGGTTSMNSVMSSSHATTNVASKTREERPEYYRTIVVPHGVASGDLFHVLLEGNKKIGAICPAGVSAGDTIIVLEPGCTKPPISPKKIAKRNARRLIDGIDKKEAPFITSAFWGVLWPLLNSNGWWYKRQKYYDFGATSFFHPGCTSVAPFNRVLNEDYFDTITGVLRYVKSLPKYEDMVKSFEKEVSRKKEAKQKKFEMRNSLDRFYMDGPRDMDKHSRIGSNYQVRSLPRPKDFKADGSNEYILEQLWDPKEASEEAFAFLNSLNHKFREEVFTSIHKANYDKSAISKPVDTEWSNMAADTTFAKNFHEMIIAENKQMRIVASSLGKSFEFCLWYYYHKYKPSKNYQLLKAHMSALKKDASKNSDECAICEDGGDLICCDNCDKAFHFTCLGLNMTDIKHSEDWSCPECLKKSKSSEFSFASTSNVSSPQSERSIA